MSDVTLILSQIESGDPKAAEQLLPLVYEELRKLAASWRSRCCWISTRTSRRSFNEVLPAGGIADEAKAYDQHQAPSVIQTQRSKVGSDAPGTFGTIGSQTRMGSVMGTPAYMPPEQALGEIDNLDERADVFELGAILCEILTGKPPYFADDGAQVYRMASRGKLEDCFARLEACGADDDLVALTKHCLELKPADRPRDAGGLPDNAWPLRTQGASAVDFTGVQR